MKREGIKRWGLYGAACWSWLLAGHFVWEVLEYNTIRSLMWLLLCLTAAGSLTGAAVVTGTIKRLIDVAYRLGHADGSLSTHCTALPTLSVMNGGLAEVVPLRADD